uniref:Uncharacterized protein n=1 Tax=Anguilla anguilla TaxID=7936 RepID=A0A0E9SQZ8_ANGAN
MSQLRNPKQNNQLGYSNTRRYGHAHTHNKSLVSQTQVIGLVSQSTQRVF